MHYTRIAVGVCTAAAVALALPAGPAAASPGDSWTQYRKVATNDAHVRTHGGQVFTGAIETDNQVRATPVVADGKVFVGNHDSGVLQAFDLATGEEIWRAQAPNWVHSEMLYQDGRVYVGFGNRYPTDGSWQNGRGTGRSGVMSLDADDGDVRWTFETPGEIMPTPALVDGTLYAVTGDRHLYEIDTVDGSLIEKTGLGHIVSMSSPAVSNGKLYFGGGIPSPYTFFAYDTAAGGFAWKGRFPEFNRGLDDVPPAVADGIVVTTANRALPLGGPGSASGASLEGLGSLGSDSGTGSGGGPREEHSIVAMDARTGDVVWRDVLGAGPAPTNNRSGAPMIRNGTVFVGSPTTGTAYAYDLHTGRRLWEVPTGAVKAAPVADGGTVYFSTTAGEVYAIDADTGEVTGTLDLDGALAPAGPVVVDDEYLVVPSQSHHVYITRLDAIPDT